MAVSKRLRYEILRRDNHTCRYCGASAPDVKLTVDHVTPAALGGTDDATNLVTACGGCNAGKSSSAPDTPLVADVEQDALRWRRAMAIAAEMQQVTVDAAYDLADNIEDDWQSMWAGQVFVDDDGGWFFKSDPDRKYPFTVVRENDDYSLTGLKLFDSRDEANRWLADHLRRTSPPKPDGWRETIVTWHVQGMRYRDIYRAMEITHTKTHVAFEHRWKYFCGVVWGMLKDRQEMAADLLARADADGEEL
jgi:hypothetical protein